MSESLFADDRLEVMQTGLGYYVMEHLDPCEETGWVPSWRSLDGPHKTRAEAEDALPDWFGISREGRVDA